MTTDSITDKIERSRVELLDLSLSNPLLNYKLLKSKGVEASGANAVEVFRSLVINRKALHFLDADAKPTADGIISTEETAEGLEERLLKTYTDATTLIEEQGINTLFIAIGMVRWRESDFSETERKAPIILIPARLDRPDINSEFNVRYSGDDLGANIAFIQKAQNDFDIDIPELPGGEETDAEDVDMEVYFADVSRAIAGMKRWSVERDSVTLGFFSFNKLLMYKDLAPDSWRDSDNPHENGMIRALLQEGFREPTSEIGEDDRLDDYLKPEDTYHIVDADSSQAKAINDVNNGRNIIIQGPPGTGKSQTITNIIAESVARGKSVLFVAEKLAALEVVARRLSSVGLGDVYIELHSHKTQKRAVINELKRTLELGEPNTDGIEDDFIALNRTRDELNEYAAAVNTPVGDTDVTPYRAYGELLRLSRQNGEPLPRLRIVGIESCSDSDYRRKADVVLELQTLLGRIGIPRDHIFYGTRLSALTPLVQADLRDGLAVTAPSLAALLEASQHLATALETEAPSGIEQVVAILPDAKGVNLEALRQPGSRQDMRTLLNLLDSYEKLHAEYDLILRPNAWNTDVSEMHRRLSENKRVLGGASASAFGQGRQFRSRWAAQNFGSPETTPTGGGIASALCRGEPPQDAEGQLALVQAIVDEQQARRDIALLSPTAEATLGDLWRGMDSDFSEIVRVVEWALGLLTAADSATAPDFDSSTSSDAPALLNALYAQVADALNTHIKALAALEEVLDIDGAKQFSDVAGLAGLAGLSFAEQERVLVEWRNGVGKVRDMVRFNIAASKVASEDIEAVVDLAQEWPGARERLHQCFENARYNAILTRAMEERSSLAGFDAAVHRRRIQQFQAMDELSMEQNRARVAHAHWSKMPDREGVGQVGTLRREFAKRRRHLTIRQLIERAGSAIQAIKPVFMMSPLSVATYLKPGSVKFDLVIFDEASQVKPVDALGTLFRGEQAVVVGDDKQLPPADFFDNVSHDDDSSIIVDDGPVTADMESILSLFYAQGAPSRMLRWHYRSRHESLIALSNNEFYNNRLVVFPSPDAQAQGVGLQYRWLDTHYTTGGVNREESKHVASAVLEHAREQPGLSLGVATFSAAQRDAIQRELEALRRQNNEHEAFFSAHPDEPFFVKNLENVQGDERDVIFISVGYGRGADGVVRQNFGPLNREGGERRLNVLISRASLRCEVFTNLHATDIRLDQNSKGGMRAFRDFLAYAETGEIADMRSASGGDSASVFQKEVTERLRAGGYECQDAVDASGFIVDIAVAHPDRPERHVIGIVCDGDSYHNSLSARDRDRLKEQVLLGLGWRLHRIWSTDWFSDPEHELERATQAIETALTD